MIWALLAAALVAFVLLLGAMALFTARTARKVEQIVPPLGDFVDVDGARLHYVQRGEGPTVVLVHGLAGHLRLFTHSLVERLSDDFHVVAVERPGAGYSVRHPGTPAGPRADAAAIAELIRTLGLSRPLLMGHSLGGAVSLAAALDHPDVVSGLALVSPLTHPVDVVPEAFKALEIRSPWVRRIVARTVAVPLSMRASARTLDLLFGPEPVPEDFAVAGGGLLSLRPQQFESASTDLVAAPDDMPGLLERYESIEVPVGILYGTGDRILDPELHGKGMRGRIPGLRVELVEGGHMLPLTQPDRVAAFVREMAMEVRGA